MAIAMMMSMIGRRKGGDEHYIYEEIEEMRCRRHWRRESARVHDGVCAACLRERLSSILSTSSSFADEGYGGIAANYEDVAVDPGAPTVAQHLRLVDRSRGDRTPQKNQQKTTRDDDEEEKHQQRTIAALIQSDMSMARSASTRVSSTKSESSGRNKGGEAEQGMGILLRAPFLTKSKSTGWILLRKREEEEEEESGERKKRESEEERMRRSGTPGGKGGGGSKERRINGMLRSYIHQLLLRGGRRRRGGGGGGGGGSPLSRHSKPPLPRDLCRRPISFD